MSSTMSLPRTAVGACACVALVGASCVIGGQTRVAQGQLYTSGNPTYDALFRDVHQQQIEQASWGDDKKGAHKTLVAALDLTPDAPDVTIVQAAHESASKVAKQPGSVRLEVDGAAPKVVAAGGAGDGAALFHAIEDTAKQELERAKRLRGMEPKLDTLTKQEGELESHAKADFAKYGEHRANEVASELVATRDVIAKLKLRAEAEARESEDFVADLGRALETASEDKVARVEPRRAKKKPREDKASAGETKSAAQTSDAPPPAAKPSPPPPKPADTGEVFTP